jgi:hypothetical protein
MGCKGQLTGKKVRAIQFEYGASWADAGCTLARAISYLAGYGYETYLLKDDAIKAFDYRMFGEFFRYSNFVAAMPGSLGAIQGKRGI